MKISTPKKGISIIICCYNSAMRLPETLKYLSRQEFSSALSIEMIVVDNASTDSTKSVAHSLWNNCGNCRIDFRVVEEKTPGLTNARNKGIAEARYDYLLFCDDDNWLSPNYAEVVFRILQNNPQIAACGGEGIPNFEIPPPDWFKTYQEAYAIGRQDIATENGRVLNLYGAGLAINKSKILELKRKNFIPYLQDRVGNNLSSAGDTELTYALVLMGYELYFIKELTFQHYIPKERLDIRYLKKLFTAFGNDGPIRNLYYSYISDRIIHTKIKNWNFHLLLSFIRFIKYLIKPPKKNGRSIYLAWNISYIKSLFRLRTLYPKLNKNIQLLQTPDIDTNQKDYELSIELGHIKMKQF